MRLFSPSSSSFPKTYEIRCLIIRQRRQQQQKRRRRKKRAMLTRAIGTTMTTTMTTTRTTPSSRVSGCEGGEERRSTEKRRRKRISCLNLEQMLSRRQLALQMEPGGRKRPLPHNSWAEAGKGEVGMLRGGEGGGA